MDLTLASLRGLRAAHSGAALAAVTTSFALVGGAVFAPYPTLLVLSLLHNGTPVGFIAERLRATERKRHFWTSVVLLGIAGVVATGWPLGWLDLAGLWHPEFSLLPSAGSLDYHLGKYVPRTWQSLSFAIPLFSAAVYLQCLHYGAVVHLLPRLGAGGVDPAGVVHWPGRTAFLSAVAVLGSVLFGGFLVSFADAPAVYSLAAAVHAWIEVPILLVALAPVAECASRPKTPHHDVRIAG